MSDNEKMSGDELRASLMGGLWVVVGIVLAALFISAAAQGVLSTAHVILAIVLLAFGVVGTYFVWTALDPNQSGAEKAKRERIDTMLRDMSDEELLALKNRLSDGDVSEDTILDFIGDDGELVTRS